MNPQPYEIWLVNVQWRRSSDARMCVVLERSPASKAVVVCGSANMAYFTARPNQFRVASDDPDFPATKLPRETFFDRDMILERDLADFVKPYGKLEGELKKRFGKWI